MIFFKQLNSSDSQNDLLLKILKFTVNFQKTTNYSPDTSLRLKIQADSILALERDILIKICQEEFTRIVSQGLELILKRLKKDIKKKKKSYWEEHINTILQQIIFQLNNSEIFKEQCLQNIKEKIQNEQTSKSF